MNLYNHWDTLESFMDSGGPVLKVLFITMSILWLLVLERFSFLFLSSSKSMLSLIESWSSRDDKESWFAHRLRDKIVSEYKGNLTASLPMIKTIVAICPLLGLMGTVT